jgi:two-component sensor histidine kinase
MASLAAKTQRFSGTYGGTTDQVPRARHAVAELLDGCVRADDAAFIVTELAANSCLHSSSSGSGEFTVRCELHADNGFVRVEVEDAGGPWRLRPTDDRSHGLDIVEALVGTDNWGVDDLPDGHRVTWVRLDLG